MDGADTHWSLCCHADIDMEDFAAARRRRKHGAPQDEDDVALMDDDLENQPETCKTSDWLANQPIADGVKRRFQHFLRTYTDDRGQRVYGQRIENMVAGVERTCPHNDWQSLPCTCPVHNTVLVLCIKDLPQCGCPVQHLHTSTRVPVYKLVYL